MQTAKRRFPGLLRRGLFGVRAGRDRALNGVLGAFIALVWLSAGSVLAALGPSHFYRTNTVNGGVDEVPLRISQAEDVTIDQWTVDQAGAVDLGSNTIPVWYLSSRTNLALVYVAATGTVVNSTGGQSRCSWTWGETIVPATRYISTIRAYDSVGGTNRYIGTLAQYYVDVSPIPDTNGYTTVIPTDLSKTVTSNQMGSGAIWNGSQWTFGVVAGSIVGVTISGGNAFSATTNASVAALVVNTNIPAERDAIALTSMVRKTDNLYSNVMFVSKGNAGQYGGYWFTNITVAITACPSNGVVRVMPGHYQESLYIGKPIRVEGSGMDVTFLEGQHDGTWRGVSGQASLRTNIVISGFTITNFYAMSPGGALWVTLENCRLTGNQSKDIGGGARYCILRNCIVEYNSCDAAGEGGGTEWCEQYDSIIRYNTAGLEGGGVYGGEAYRCRIEGNTGTEGAGAYGAYLRDCVVTGNVSDATSNCKIERSIIYGNVSGGTVNDSVINGVGWYSGGITINGGAASLTGQPIYAESDPIWAAASNWYVRTELDPTAWTSLWFDAISPSNYLALDGLCVRYCNTNGAGGGAGEDTLQNVVNRGAGITNSIVIEQHLYFTNSESVSILNQGLSTSTMPRVEIGCPLGPTNYSVPAIRLQAFPRTTDNYYHWDDIVIGNHRRAYGGGEGSVIIGNEPGTDWMEVGSYSVMIGNSRYSWIGGTTVGNSSVGIGGSPQVGSRAVGIGQRCSVGDYSVGLGDSIVAGAYSVAIGGDYSICTVANDYSIAIGSMAHADGGIAIGIGAISTGACVIAIGYQVSNSVPDSARVRGTLYLDGGTGVMCRATFGSGAWAGIHTDGTNLFFVNSTGAVVQITNL